MTLHYHPDSAALFSQRLHSCWHIGRGGEAFIMLSSARLSVITASGGDASSSWWRVLLAHEASRCLSVSFIGRWRATRSLQVGIFFISHYQTNKKPTNWIWWPFPDPISRFINSGTSNTACAQSILPSQLTSDCCSPSPHCLFYHSNAHKCLFPTKAFLAHLDKWY